MSGKQIVTSLDIILRWVLRLAVINLLWFLFSLIGALAGGVFPATAAVLGITRKMIMGEQEIHIWHTFKEIYLKEFVRSNIIGWVLTLVGALLYLNYQVISNAGNEIPFVVPFAFYLVLFFYFITVLWSFPLMAHYEGPWFQHVKNALIIGLSKIQYTLASGLIVFAVIYFSLDFPGLIPFFSISISSLGCMWFSMRIFMDLDQRLLRS